eukprot:SAG25_NODE_4259_length_853_cov_1.718833_1_plen_64_part_01
MVAKCGAWSHAPWPNAGPPPTASVRVSETLTLAVGGGHTILEFAAAEKSLDLHGRKIGINSSWT